MISKEFRELANHPGWFSDSRLPAWIRRFPPEIFLNALKEMERLEQEVKDSRADNAKLFTHLFEDHDCDHKV